MKIIIPRYSRVNQIKLLQRNIKNVFFGSLKYFCKYPITSIPIFYKRFGFSFLRKEIFNPFKTPEGFILKNDMELLVHSQEFIEQNLYFKPMIKELKTLKQNFNIIDVGANVGFFSQWIGSFNPHGIFSCVEIWDKNIKRGREINKTLAIAWHNNAAHNKSGEELSFNIGDVITLLNTTNVKERKQVFSLAIDDITKYKQSIFAMKIDTDGNNVNILEGARDTLHKTKWLLIEYEPGVREWMELNAPGFKLMKWTSPDDMIYRNTYIV